MMDERKECPYCNYPESRIESWQIESGDRHTEYAVLCLNCGAMGPNDMGASGAVEMWNLRRPMDAERKARERAERERGELHQHIADLWAMCDKLPHADDCDPDETGYCTCARGEFNSMLAQRPGAQPDERPQTNGVEIRSTRSVMPNHFWIGAKEESGDGSVPAQVQVQAAGDGISA